MILSISDVLFNSEYTQSWVFRMRNLPLGNNWIYLCCCKLMFKTHVFVVLTFTLIAAGRPPLLIQGCSSTSSRRWSEEK